MIQKLIEFSVRNKLLVLFLTAALLGAGIWAMDQIRLDAIPDLSEVQVIVVTEYPGQNPEVVENQISYPLTSALLSVPGATDVRGFSMFETSFVYVLFEDGTDLYWARSRVLEYLNFARDRLPQGVEPKLGPDATGVGWVLQYVLYPGYYCPNHPKQRGLEKAGVCPIDGTQLLAANQDLSQLRSIQDWYLRFPLSSVEGVSEVASIGGFVRQYQVLLEPDRLLAYGIGVEKIAEAIRQSNHDVGGSVIELSEQEYLVRSRAYLRGLEDLGQVVLGSAKNGTPIFLRDVAKLQIAGESRRGVGEWNGEGEAVGGIIVSRFGENAYKVIQDAKQRLFELEDGLPPGVFFRISYDRSALIERSVNTLRTAVIEELIVTALICVVFLFHIRSAFVAILVLPIGLLISLLVMQWLGINANIMSLGGLALAISVMVDSAIVMIENAHQCLQREKARMESGETSRVEVILQAAKEVGPSLFYSLLIITVSFLPIFVLGDQSGKLFKPLAFTKTFAIAAGAILGITVVPALMVLWIRGRIPKEEDNPVNRFSEKVYEPAFHFVLRHPKSTLAVVCLLGLSTLYPLSRLGSEFMPALDEGDLLYMPTTDPSISITKAKELLQQTDKLIASFPEVRSVHGKIGRAETATDPAPLSMIETVIQLETDPEKWRKRSEKGFLGLWSSERKITTEELLYGWEDTDGTKHPGMNQALSFPGMANSWPYPIENRINMLSTGIKTPVGVKILGPDLQTLSDLAERTALAIRGVKGTQSAYAEKTLGGYYLDFEIDREEAARHGLSVGDVQNVLLSAIGGMNVTYTVEGRERYPVNLRYARELRDNLPSLKAVLVATPSGTQIPLGQIARIEIHSGPPMIKSENAQRSAWVYVDFADRDLGSYVEEAKHAVEKEVPLPAGYQLRWAGSAENFEKTKQRLQLVIPITAALIIFLLYLSNRSWFRVGVVLLAVPFSLIGAFWFLFALDYNLSLAVWVGIIALLGIDAETGQIMLLYLDQSYDRLKVQGRMRNESDLLIAIHEGAVKRIRPKTMTVATDMIGLLPLLWATGTGADVTRPLVAPLIGGITVSFLMELLVYPVIFYLWKKRSLPLNS